VQRQRRRRAHGRHHSVARGPRPRAGRWCPRRGRRARDRRARSRGWVVARGAQWTAGMSPPTVDRRAQLGRLGLAVARVPLPALAAGLAGAVVAGAALWLCAFEAAHDLVHDALGLGRRAGAVALAAAGALMLGSGHAMLVSHLWHHKRPFADDDYEG